MALPVSDEISLDLTPGKVMPVVNVSQFDKGRVIKVNLTNNGVPYIVRDTDSFVINVRKPDGTIVTSSCGPGSISGVVYTYIYFTTSVQMAAVAGDSLCEIKITDSEDSSEDPNVIGTLNFILRVEKDPIDGGVQSASAIHDLAEQVRNSLGEMKISDLSDVDDYQGVEGNTLRFDGTSRLWKTRMDVYGRNVTAEAGSSSFNAMFMINSEAINKDKIVRVYRDSYDSNPPTGISVSESGMRLDVTVNFEAESSDSNWRVEVEICRTSGT